MRKQPRGPRRRVSGDAVTYLGFPAPRGKLSFDPPTQPVHGSTDAKNELGIKGRRKLTRTLQSPAHICL